MPEQPLFSNETKVISLEQEAQFVLNGIVSRTLFRANGTRQVLFGFAEGQELTEHTSPHHALIQIISGQCEFSLKSEPRTLKSGDVLYMPPGLPHAVRATSQFSMLLTLVSTQTPPAAA
jgi:quercetin dioxygenase-like cupin family protein